MEALKKKKNRPFFFFAATCEKAEAGSGPLYKD